MRNKNRMGRPRLTMNVESYKLERVRYGWRRIIREDYYGVYAD